MCALMGSSRVYNGNYCFRPQWPTGIPRAIEAVSRASGAEGVEGNVHASRAWKGNDRSRSRASDPPVSRTSKIQLSIREAALPLTDKYGRVIHDLRISITDRCNYKCVYCRSGNDGPPFPEMPVGEYLRMVRVFVELGITKVRLTGGEPLLRRELVEMVRELAKMRTLEGKPLDIAITTNGHLLAELAQPLDCPA
jgi:sulfatase maturation enzyme AslB (radical SAM superfamily)